jgi:succinoglycan biosynthesis protein ExoA
VSAAGQATPRFAVVVPIAPGRDPLVLRSLEQQDEPECSYEVVVERGRNVSRNRNTGIGRTRAPILAFTDDDCVVERDWLARARRFFDEHPDCDAVGGPQLNLDGEGALGRAIGAALGSPFGTARTRYRFKPGPARLDATQFDLTSANLFVTRRALARWGQFDERLWPNEETALLRRIELGGGRIAYEPSITVRHRRRDSPRRLFEQCLGYGRGRARQWAVEGVRTPAPEQWVPCAFLFYVATLPLAAWLWPPALLPLALYAALSLAIAVGAALRRRDPALGALLPLVFAIIHLAYPAGIVCETVRAARRRPAAAPFAGDRAVRIP